LSNPNSNIVAQSNGTNPYHLHVQEPRLPPPVVNCSDCDTPRGIDGGVPVDLYHVADGTEAGITLHLCLGDLASRRALGQQVSRVEAVE
jgi:hypothetical protein